MKKMPSVATADDLWQFVWRALAAQGACDTWGSEEQRRITLMWHAAGRPAGVAEYIIAKANEIPAARPTT